MSEQEEVIKQVYLELDRIRQVKKCTSCECLLDVLDAVQEDFSKVGTPQAKTALEDMRLWFKEGNEKRHKCLGCEECLPIKPYNRFSSLQADISKTDHLKAQPASTCDCGST